MATILAVIYFVKNNYKLVLTGLLVLMILSVSGYVVYLRSQLEKERYEHNRWENNYNSEVYQSHIYHLQSGEQVAEAQAQVLTQKEITKSKDKELSELKKYAEKLNIKIKNLENMVLVHYDTIIDTTFYPIFLPIEGGYKEIDSLVIDSSYIKREFNSVTKLAHYSIHLGGSIYIYYEPAKKEGKWKLINIFVWRKKAPTVTVTSNSKLLNFKGVKMVIIEKGRKFSLFK